MNGFGIDQAIILWVIAIQAFIFNGGKNQIMIVISQELILQSVGILLVNLSFGLDDLVGSSITLFLLPQAGCESAQAQAQLIAYYPQRGSIAFR